MSIFGASLRCEARKTCPAEVRDILCFYLVLGSRSLLPCSANLYHLPGGLLLCCPCEKVLRKKNAGGHRSSPPVTRAMAILSPHVLYRASVAVQTEECSGRIMEKDPTHNPEMSPPAAISEASRTSLMTRIDTLALECGLMWQDLDKIHGPLDSAETHISDVKGHHLKPQTKPSRTCSVK